ncbi:MAG: tRNA (adenosine(37)-N6)-threonylcarbamoyltransferase complex ATPase subunit type 1 TsaE [Planctomycetota bacterium]
MTSRTSHAWVTDSIERTWALGAALGQGCQPGDAVLLEGELGAGKTQLVRGMARGMGLDPSLVTSPTFVLMREYESPGGQALLVHIDAYRVGSAAELVDAGYDADLRAAGVTAIEWPSRVDGLVDLADPRVLSVQIDHAAADRRRVQLGGDASRVEAIRLAFGHE